MQSYYKVTLEIGKKKFEKRERVIYVRTSSEKPIDDVLTAIKKIKTAKMIATIKIDRDRYIQGVSSNAEWA